MATPVHDTHSRGSQAVTTSIAFVAIAGLFVIFRSVARLGLVRRCGADDVLIVCALALSIALTALIKAQEQNGLGRHFNSLAPGEYSKMLKPFWASVVVYNLGLTLVKCSILCQFLRFFVDPKARRICWTILAIVIAYGLGNLFGSIFACTPISYFWDKTTQKGHCINLLAFWFSNASFNIVSDISICILPIPVLRSLQLPNRQKYGLFVVFVLGGFGCVTSILRLHSLYIVSHSNDVTWDNVGAATWSSVELNVGIICACLPTLKPVLSYLFPRLIHSRHRDTVELRPDTYMRHSVGRDTGSDGRRMAGESDMTNSMNSIHQTRAYEIEDSWDEEQTACSPTVQNYSWSISALKDEKRGPSRGGVSEMG